jgi:hypothetical protein
MMNLDEAIKHCEEVASECEFDTDWGMGNHFIDRSDVADVIECAKEHRQLASWLSELEESRKIIDVFLQTFVDFDLDICCDDLIMDAKEEDICYEKCNNKTKDCWLRWAKLKAREVNADEDGD